MKVGDMVKHVPWKDQHVRWLNEHSHFTQGLVIECQKTAGGIHYLINAHSRKLSWYRETELELVNESR